MKDALLFGRMNDVTVTLEIDVPCLWFITDAIILLTVFGYPVWSFLRQTNSNRDPTVVLRGDRILIICTSAYACLLKCALGWMTHFCHWFLVLASIRTPNVITGKLELTTFNRESKNDLILSCPIVNASSCGWWRMDDKRVDKLTVIFKLLLLSATTKPFVSQNKGYFNMAS